MSLPACSWCIISAPSLFWGRVRRAGRERRDSQVWGVGHCALWKKPGTQLVLNQCLLIPFFRREKPSQKRYEETTSTEEKTARNTACGERVRDGKNQASSGCS